MAVGRLRLIARLQLAALVFQDEDNGVCDAEQDRCAVLDGLPFFEAQVELDDVKVGDELLDLAVATLVHVEDGLLALQDLLLKDELGPVPALVLLVRKISEELTDLDVVARRNLLDQVDGDLLGNLLRAQNVLQDAVECLDKELDGGRRGRVLGLQHLDHVEVEEPHRLLVHPLTDLVHAQGFEELLHVGSDALFDALYHGVTRLVQDQEEAAHEGLGVPHDGLVRQFRNEDPDGNVDREVLPRLLHLVADALDQD